MGNGLVNMVAGDSCNHCGLFRGIDDFDPCIGFIDGVKNACCGHGFPENSYVQFDHDEYDVNPNRDLISGLDAWQYLAEYKGYINAT